MTQIHQAVARLITDAYYKAKRRTRSKWKRHARPMTWRELQDLARDNYPAYLRTAHWKRTKSAALRRAVWRCQDCDDDLIELHVHHLEYKRLGREKPRDLRVLCARCHAREHGK